MSTKTYLLDQESSVRAIGFVRPATAAIVTIDHKTGEVTITTSGIASDTAIRLLEAKIGSLATQAPVSFDKTNTDSPTCPLDEVDLHHSAGCNFGSKKQH